MAPIILKKREKKSSPEPISFPPATTSLYSKISLFSLGACISSSLILSGVRSNKYIIFVTPLTLLVKVSSDLDQSLSSLALQGILLLGFLSTSLMSPQTHLLDPSPSPDFCPEVISSRSFGLNVTYVLMTSKCIHLA